MSRSKPFTDYDPNDRDSAEKRCKLLRENQEKIIAGIKKNLDMTKFKFQYTTNEDNFFYIDFLVSGSSILTMSCVGSTVSVELKHNSSLLSIRVDVQVNEKDEPLKFDFNTEDGTDDQKQILRALKKVLNDVLIPLMKKTKPVTKTSSLGLNEQRPVFFFGRRVYPGVSPYRRELSPVRIISGVSPYRRELSPVRIIPSYIRYPYYPVSYRPLNFFYRRY